MEPIIKTIRLLIVDDHQMVRDGIRMMLESKANLFHFDIDEAENGEIAVRKVLKQEYDIILMDYQLPGMNGPETLQQVRLYRKDIKILALSNYDEFSYIKSMMNEGANGYILKNIDPSQLVHAIDYVLSGKPYYSNEVALKLLDSGSENANELNARKSGLSKREMEILKMITHEMTNDEIAKKLFISKRTVDTHRQNLLKKLNVRNAAGLMKAALQLGLLEK